MCVPVQQVKQLSTLIEKSHVVYSNSIGFLIQESDSLCNILGLRITGTWGMYCTRTCGKSCRLLSSPSVTAPALWSCISHCSHLHSHCKVIWFAQKGHQCSVFCLRFTSSLIVAYVAPEFSDEQRAYQTEVSTLNMHESCTSWTQCKVVNDFPLSHYDKLRFIAIVARQHDCPKAAAHNILTCIIRTSRSNIPWDVLMVLFQTYPLPETWGGENANVHIVSWFILSSY